jgi:hypothetical protein
MTLIMSKKLSFLRFTCGSATAKALLIALLFASGVSVSAQDLFKGKLINKADQLPVEFAIIKSIDLGCFTQTNANGEFSFKMPASLKTLRFEVSAIGMRDTLTVKRSRKDVEILYIERPLLSLTPVNIKGLSAKETVKLAVDMIPVNYSDSSYAAYSFFRQYNKVNGKFKNLIEAQTIVLLKLELAGKRFKTSYGFDVEQMRRSNFNYDIADFEYFQDNITYLLREDPVYNLLNGALNPNAFNFYEFNFDTNNRTDDFVIKYRCREFTSELHGVENIRDLDWYGEGTEEGRFVIDSKTYAFKRIERTAVRNKAYNYPHNNNWVLPSRNYWQEFVDGNMVTEYDQVNGKWFLTKIFHAYTNDFFDKQTTKKAFSITEAFEWYADSTTHFIPTELTNRFFVETYLPSSNYTYHHDKWNTPLPAFYFYKKEDVYKDIEKTSPAEVQFENNGK